MTPQSLENYQAYYSLHPEGSRADDWRTALICHAAVGAMQGDKTPSAKSFLPIWDHVEPSPEQAKQFFDAWAQAHNAKNT